MQVAVLSDVHSNPYALRAVLAAADRAGAEELWLLGDTFGYHPWARATFAAATGADVAVIGNHDRWVLEPETAPTALFRSVSRQNAADLQVGAPAGLQWLATLPAKLTLEREGWRVTLVHGTPDHPLDGRYYPDDDARHRWLPGPGEILLLGQTHHPINRGTAATGLVLNPGSVGQPRDGNPMPSWALLDLGSGRARLCRTGYDHITTIELLHRQGWDRSIVAALDRECVLGGRPLGR